VSDDQQVLCTCCGIRNSEFTEDQIERMRTFLAKQWRQTKDQITEYEAIDQLRREKQT
jgi:hypothetical protein